MRSGLSGSQRRCYSIGHVPWQRNHVSGSHYMALYHGRTQSMHIQTESWEQKVSEITWINLRVYLLKCCVILLYKPKWFLWLREYFLPTIVQFLSLENTFDGKDYVCGRMLQFLMKAPKSEENMDIWSFHLLEMLLYRVHLSLFTGKYQNAIALFQVFAYHIISSK